MAENRQESRASDGVVKTTPQQRYRLGIEKVSLKGLRIISSNSINTENYIDVSCKIAFLMCKIKYVGVNLANNESTTELIKRTQNQNLKSQRFKIERTIIFFVN